jgi:phosphatidate cytidylyltransferase
MSDDIWRDRRDDDDFREFGSLFDEAPPTENIPEVPSAGPEREPEPEKRLDFDDSGSGSLPHWTEPATGELPRYESGKRAATQSNGGDDHPELDVWSSFSSESPVWKDDEQVEPAEPHTARHDQQPTGQQRYVDDERDQRRTAQQRRVSDQQEQPRTAQQRRVTDQHDRVSGPHPRVSGESEAVQREPSRITIGTDPSGMPRRPPAQSGGRRRGGPPPSPGRKQPGPGAPSPSGRDMPTAIAVGLLLAAAFIAALMYKPVAAAAVIVVILGLAAVEFYDKVAEKGYRPAVVPGIVTCVGRIGSAWAHCHSFLRSGSWRPPAASSAPAASTPDRCPTSRSPRSESCGSGCSDRSPC